ncbi:uncharacterized membrane protein YsdA (DUF1294 family) [Melghiribacillus thermohalophilus]|uniref:Uncharacterized membrane protein YsdA (DUF1294 family) n=1 Tax=Melghiribacillus thermohalophilus TaxID=1324956 RepID=A0A4R3N6Y0_9BACI|nr:DUF1294 domain-containing protein [Melghiribacillus thermohalophilus]TCT25030.1 uncharacterized membrane protein YsdA (DUF1294 family) [Melghiribacillus thermohalophilus]
MNGWWLYYFVFVNAVTVGLMGTDKYRARKGKWRIRERTIFLWSLAGGAFGTLFAMYLYRHKTKHQSFILIIPVLTIVHGVLLIYFGMMS